MRARGTQLPVPLWLLAVHLAGLIAFGAYTRAQLETLTQTYGATFTFGEVVLEAATSPYVISYWVLPIAAWCALRQVHTSASVEHVLRYPTRSDWAVSQGLRALPWAVTLVAALTAVSLFVSGWGYPVGGGWGPASADPTLGLTATVLSRSFPLPALAIAVQVVALSLTLMALTAIVAAAAVTDLDRPRRATIAALALVLWSIVSLHIEGRLADIFGLATYAVVPEAVLALPFGPGGGVMVLLVGGALLYAGARRLELRFSGPGNISMTAVVIGVGMLVLLGLMVSVPDGWQPSTAMLMLLQGVDPEGFSLLPYLANAILVLVPTILCHRDLVASLSGRRYTEMIRMHSPARWYALRLRAAAATAGRYAAALTAWSVLVIAMRTGEPPRPAQLVQAGAWGLALGLQVLVATVMLALGTIAARRIEGGGYALGAVLVLALPLGSASRWSPSGQASLARMADLTMPNPRLHPLPLLVLAGWLIVLTGLTQLSFNRTRGELL